MRPIIMVLLIALALTPEATMAARWEKATVSVWDFTPEEWRPYVQATVDDFNANLPPGAPELAYVPMGELPCDALPKYGKMGGVSVCAGRGDLGRSTTNTIAVDRTLLRAKIMLDPADVSRLAMNSCHEMTHAVLDTPDNYSLPHLDDSCVQGLLDHLGPWDIAYAAQVYATQPDHGHRSGKRHRHQSNHHN
jgi:hypothetical protein